MGCWYDETFDDQVRYGLRVEQVLYRGRSEFQEIEVIETSRWGRVLCLDGVFNTSDGDEWLYHEMLVHPAMVLAPRVARVLVVGGGDGGTIREVLRHHDVERCTLVEIDEEVVRVSKEYLPNHGTAWDDPRLTLEFRDGLKFVADAAPDSFDVILVDGTDPIGAGTVLFGERFLADCRRCLAPDGLFCIQSESPLLMPDAFAAIQGRLRGAFADVHPYLGPVPIYAAGVWSYSLCGEDLSPGRPNRERQGRLGGLQYYCPEVHDAAFALPPFVRRLIRGEKG